MGLCSEQADVATRRVQELTQVPTIERLPSGGILITHTEHELRVERMMDRMLAEAWGEEEDDEDDDE